MNEAEEFEFALAFERERSAKPAAPSLAKTVATGAVNMGRDLAAGAVRGAGSIGATLLAPIDAAARAMNGGQPVSINGYDIVGQNRRAGMDAGLASLGADTNSLAFGAGKLGGEIAGTAGAGGAAANLLGRVPAIAAAAPNALQALATGGMSGGNMLTRTAGGALNGALTAGMVDPSQAGTGAAVGGALPGALKVAGAVGQKVGSVIRGPAQSADLTQAVQGARQAGYVIPPTQAKPSLANRALEGFSGKITTAQNASAKNQTVTNELASKALGLPPETKITTEVLDSLRAEAGKAYGAVSKLGKMDATGAVLPVEVKVQTGINPLLGGKTQSVDAAELVRAWKQANHDATAYYRSYGRTADPETLAKAKNNAAAAKQIDEFLSAQLDKMGRTDLGESLKAARVKIAKSYSVEDALNATSGNVDARRLAKQLDKKKPLSGELKQAAEFAARFPKAAQAVEGMGSLPQTSPLDFALGATLSGVTANPLGLASVLARPGARALSLSPLVQNRLAQNPNALQMMMDPALAQMGYRAAPVIAADR